MGDEREEVLETLHDAAADIQGSDTVAAACERTVAAAEDILEFELCSVVLHDDGYLDPAALSSGSPPEAARRIPVDTGIAGRTFRTGESVVLDSIEPDDDSDPAKDTYRSGLSVPVGDLGVFQAVETVEGAFDDRDVELAELLVAHTARTINRLSFEAELKEKQAALERQNERLERFVGAVSHDLRNPLAVAQGRLDLARAEHDSDHLAVVAQSHERMESLVDAMLQLARDGRPVEAPEPVDLGALATRCWETLPSESGTCVLDDAPTVLADPDRLRQLLENLFSNAVEHGTRDGSVTVTVGALPDGFYVADDGPGVPPDQRERVLEWGVSNDEDGTGFGLAIVREIADAHGWSVRLTEAESGGARFEFTDVEPAADGD